MNNTDFTNAMDDVLDKCGQATYNVLTAKIQSLNYQIDFLLMEAEKLDTEEEWKT